ncbi:hypothetical protein SHELI_v1c10340 [Spiroplasma helicoides]|uniref:Uncharacterized protein n=1 Tax=Spiroplasma helicoides TaxID=216938 RepID=A0A1B3SM16_9MOLU|nr:hypothetical protein [Spiroplasma helicoides]AOG60981.1 hypothetical protein SHELI_v1c10340 [Spiroplasma helicoides]
MKINLMSKVNNYKHIFSLFFKNIFVNFKTYIFCWVIPAAIFIILTLLSFKNKSGVLLPPLIMNYLSISVYFSAFFVGILVIDWKKRNYLVKLRLGNLNTTNFLSILFLNNLIIVAGSFLINLGIYNIMVYSEWTRITYKLLQNINGPVWSLFFINMLFMLLFLTAGVMLLTSASKKAAINFLSIALFVVLLMMFSDSVIDPDIMNSNTFTYALGFLNPIKYFVWTGMLFTSYSFYDKMGISQIMPLESPHIPFNNLLPTVLPSILFLVGMIILYNYLFKWGYKQ